MKAKVQLTYSPKGDRKPREIEVDVRDGLKGKSLLNAVEKAVERAAKDDPDWVSWDIIASPADVQ